MNPFKVLIVEDDEDLSEILRYNLINAGYLVDVSYTAEEAMHRNIKEYNILLIDVMLG